MNDPLVSIFIPCYNYGNYVLEAIESCLNQTYKNIEVIVVNDGSTDQLTNDFFKTYSHPKVQLFTTENQGLPKTRNYAVSKTKGEYIIPLDADDKLAPTFVEETLKIMLSNKELGVVYTDQQFFGEENDVMTMQEFNLVDELIQNHVSVSSLVKRETYNAVKNKNGFGYNPNLVYGYEDWDFWISVAELNYKFECVHKTLFWYRKSKTSMMSQTAKKIDPAITQLIENHSDLFEKHHKRIIAKLHYKFREREIYAKNLEEDTKSNKWITKKFIKNLKD